MADEDQFDKEVYKALYEFQLKGLESVKALHAKHEDKAAKYLTFTSIIIAAVSIFSKQYLFDVVCIRVNWFGLVWQFKTSQESVLTCFMDNNKRASSPF